MARVLSVARENRKSEVRDVVVGILIEQTILLLREKLRRNAALRSDAVTTRTAAVGTYYTPYFPLRRANKQSISLLLAKHV